MTEIAPKRKLDPGAGISSKTQVTLHNLFKVPNVMDKQAAPRKPSGR